MELNANTSSVWRRIFLFSALLYLSAGMGSGLASSMGVSRVSGAASGDMKIWLPKEKAELPVHKVAVFGKDTRRRVPKKLRRLANKIGLLFNRRSSTLCTAFCLAPNVVATASHCLFGRGNRFINRKLSRFYFRRGDASRANRDVRIEGAVSGTARQYVVAGTTRLHMKPPIGAARDWALVRLAKPACRKGHFKVKTTTPKELETASKNKRIFQLAYHRDFPKWKLAYSRACPIKREFSELSWKTISRQFDKPKNLILHHCDTGGASSGSPLFINTKAGPRIVGISVGTYQQGNLLIEGGKVVGKSRYQTVANTGVNASAFLPFISILRRAKILKSRQQVMQLQMLLREHGYYKVSNKIDGIYGYQTEIAVKTYQHDNGLPASGLPTQKLVQHLRNNSVVHSGAASSK